MENPKKEILLVSDPAIRSCDLCGLPLRHATIKAEILEKSYDFCCQGCRQVYNILLLATDSGDPETFKETELFKQCRAKGIIPNSEADLASVTPPTAVAASASVDIGHPETEKWPADFSKTVLELNLRVENMWCPACAWLIDEILNKTRGIVDSACNFATDRIQVNYNPIQTSPAQIISNIGKLGYRAALPNESEGALESRKEFIRFAISAFLTMNIMMMSYALYSGFFIELTPDTIFKLSWPAFVMATVVLMYGGYEFYKKAWVGITNAAFSMETLISMGALSAYSYSTYSFLSGSIHLYFDTASMLITLVLLGKTLERRAKGQVLEGLENFLALRPVKARICTDDFPGGRYVAAEQLVAGAILRVEENEIVAADGRVLFGIGSVDESSLTGEPLPISKKPGDFIRSGTRVIRGTFKIKTEKVGDDSTLGQMIGIIEKTLSMKTPLEGKTDVILQWFVPVIFVLVAGTALIGHKVGLSTEMSILRAVTVMVISCPCALGIAIPLARVAGISIAGKKGILVRTFSAFERAEKISAFVFDKTGTITEGKWNLKDIVPMAPITQDQALALAAGMERDSDHFIAAEILAQAIQKKIRPLNVVNTKVDQKGVSGEAEGRQIKIGSTAFLDEEINKLDARQKKRVLNPKSKHSHVYLGVDGRLVAVFVFGDALRKSASSTIEKLHRWDYQLALVSGDGVATTKTIGQKIGIEAAYGAKLPQDKADFVAKLQKQGFQVAMVGDGINDALALVQADLSMAIYSGGQLSKETADITLMRGEPGQVIDFLELAVKVNKKIKQNLIFTFLYNVISIPIAISGLLTPLLAACAMLLSSLSVTANTLRLVRKNA